VQKAKDQHQATRDAEQIEERATATA
jgi:hypothetical protein